MGRGDPKRKRAARRAARQADRIAAGVMRRDMPEATPAPADPRGELVRPTPERQRRGKWVEHDPQRRERSAAMVDLAHDAIAQLHGAGLIDHRQEQAARDWQELRAAYLAEHPEIGGHRSCLAAALSPIAGYDDSDGSAETIQRYRRIEARMTLRQRQEIEWATEAGGQVPPTVRALLHLRAALDVVAGG